uniref:Macaca fascicularis brain cDNA, clone: QflA-19733 n=1 Tax=Macaca fascicularis TaxID=9541 RepID=I7GN74_MACFA|nr:unnamed protein product [Macaca fascicularis]
MGQNRTFMDSSVLLHIKPEINFSFWFPTTLSSQVMKGTPMFCKLWQQCF